MTDESPALTQRRYSRIFSPTGLKFHFGFGSGAQALRVVKNKAVSKIHIFACARHRLSLQNKKCSITL
jgi:hypothetical protein